MHGFTGSNAVVDAHHAQVNGSGKAAGVLQVNLEGHLLSDLWLRRVKAHRADGKDRLFVDQVVLRRGLIGIAVDGDHVAFRGWTATKDRRSG